MIQMWVLVPDNDGSIGSKKLNNRTSVALQYETTVVGAML